MPVNQSKMRKLREQYGKEKGTRIYYKMEQQENKKKGGKKKSAIQRAMGS